MKKRILIVIYSLVAVIFIASSYVASQQPKFRMNRCTAQLILLKGGYRTVGFNYCHGFTFDEKGNEVHHYHKPWFFHLDMRKFAKVNHYEVLANAKPTDSLINSDGQIRTVPVLVGDGPKEVVTKIADNPETSRAVWIGETTNLPNYKVLEERPVGYPFVMAHYVFYDARTNGPSRNTVQLELISKYSETNDLVAIRLVHAMTNVLVLTLGNTNNLYCPDVVSASNLLWTLATNINPFYK